MKFSLNNLRRIKNGPWQIQAWHHLFPRSFRISATGDEQCYVLLQPLDACSQVQDIFIQWTSGKKSFPPSKKGHKLLLNRNSNTCSTSTCYNQRCDFDDHFASSLVLKLLHLVLQSDSNLMLACIVHTIHCCPVSWHCLLTSHTFDIPYIPAKTTLK